MVRRVIVPFLVLLPVAWSPTSAADQTVVLDPKTTEITFFLKATGHGVNGTLYLEQGEVRFDLDRGTASGEVTIDARRAETGNSKRDKTMHRKVLESEAHPKLALRVTGLEGQLAARGSSTLTLAGTLAIHGDEHPMSLPLEIERDGDEISVTTTFVVPYVDWGMRRPSFLFLKVAPEVVVRVAATGQLNRSALSDGN